MLAVCAIAVAALFAASPSSAQVRLKMMTFNIRYDNPADSIYNWSHRKDMVYEVMDSVKPDVAGLQEVLFSQLTELKGRLKDYSFFGVGRDDGEIKGEFVPVMYKTSRFSKVDGSYFWLSKTPDVAGSKSWKTACTRMVTWVMLRDRQTNMVFFVFNTHFDHASEEARVESARLLKAKIAEITSGRPVIICGDFNSTSEGEAYKILTATSATAVYFRDSRLCAPDSLSRKEPLYSFGGFPFQAQNGNIIDFIFTGSRPPWKTVAYHVVTISRSGRYPSDHLPVTAEFEIKSLK